MEKLRSIFCERARRLVFLDTFVSPTNTIPAQGMPDRKEGRKEREGEEDSDICLLSVYMDKRGGDDEE